MRFEEKKDHYLDINIGLKWSKENFGPMSWDKTIKQFDGSNGWRLPTVEELITLVDRTKLDPATDLPKMLSSFYWSSATYAYYSGIAWYVHFYFGYDNYYLKSNAYYVRAVRTEKEKINAISR